MSLNGGSTTFYSWNVTVIDGAKASIAEFFGRVEVVGSLNELGVGEDGYVEAEASIFNVRFRGIIR